MLRFVVGSCLATILLSLVFTAWAYFLVCLGLHPEAVEVVGLWAPLLALFYVGVMVGGRSVAGGSGRAWLAGLYPAIGMIIIWFAVWCYLAGRSSPAGWWREGLAGLSGAHFTEWFLAVLFGLAGSACGYFAANKAWKRMITLGSMVLLLLVLTALLLISSWSWNASELAAEGMTMSRGAPERDGTAVRFFTFDFAANPGLSLHLYDADMDDGAPFNDANSSYMGQGIDLIAAKLDHRTRKQGGELLCAFNSGFFGARGDRVAFHEAPVVIDGVPHYNVDLIRPKDQAWVLAFNSPARIREGGPRFLLVPEMAWNDLPGYQTVLAGVRPLRVEDRSVPLEPGIGSTKLRCSRTSIGWSASGDKLFVLIERDPDTEGASNLQRRGGKTQTGGWDIREVQAFWEKLGVPNAVLLDGGESTQAVYRNAQNRLVLLRAGYHAGLPLGHLWDRPMVAFPAMLPRLQNSRGVLNYLYVDWDGK